MKRSTAIRHLVELADVASDGLRLATTEIGWPLVELWVTGALIDPVDELEHGSVVLMIELPPDELPWLAVHPTAAGATSPGRDSGDLPARRLEIVVEQLEEDTVAVDRVVPHVVGHVECDPVVTVCRGDEPGIAAVLHVGSELDEKCEVLASSHLVPVRIAVRQLGGCDGPDFTRVVPEEQWWWILSGFRERWPPGTRRSISARGNIGAMSSLRSGRGWYIWRSNTMKPSRHPLGARPPADTPDGASSATRDRSKPLGATVGGTGTGAVVVSGTSDSVDDGASVSGSVDDGASASGSVGCVGEHAATIATLIHAMGTAAPSRSRWGP
jgi:hypothetical protein